MSIFPLSTINSTVNVPVIPVNFRFVKTKYWIELVEPFPDFLHLLTSKLYWILQKIWSYDPLSIMGYLDTFWWEEKDFSYTHKINLS